MRELLSVVIPARNEERNIGLCLDELIGALEADQIPFEIIVVDDASDDDTAQVVDSRRDARIHLIQRVDCPGFGRAIRAGLDAVRGEFVVIYMADRSDDPNDVVAYYAMLEKGFDCVFGSRFITGGSVKQYPPVKWVANRIVNRTVQLLFWTQFNDLTNAFKAYRADVIQDCGPFSASHFNITLEMSLSALIREYRTAQIPIRWYGRSWGSTHLRLRDMGRKYLYVVVKMWAERILVKDDIMADRQVRDRART